MSGHVPVLLGEVIAALAPRDGEVHVDGTFGGGGYARALLDAADITLIGIDRDPDAVTRAQLIAEREPRLVPLAGRFGEADALVAEAGFGPVDGFVLDLGVSSFQIDQAARGFSFQADGPLDMRMSGSGPSAADVVNTLSADALAAILFRLGEERQSRRIARAIVADRDARPFTRTLELAELVERVLGGRRGEKIHPATRSFQALRLYVNDELGELARALSASVRLLKPGGRLVVVTFHSLEDRLVKQTLKAWSGSLGGGSRHAPKVEAGPLPLFSDVSRKPVMPGENEVRTNPRARSAKLRMGVRTSAPATETGRFDLPDLRPLSDVEQL